MGEYVRPVPWLVPGECDGCYFNTFDKVCPNGTNEFLNMCDSEGKYEGKIFIEATPEAFAKYITARLTHETTQT